MKKPSLAAPLALACALLCASPALAQVATYTDTVGGARVTKAVTPTDGLPVNCVTGCSGGSGGGASVGSNGATAPTSSNQTGYVNGSGNLTADSPTNPHPVTDAALLAAINGTLNFGSTETGGTTGSAGTFATVLAANSARHGCLIQNTSATDKILVYFGLLGSATTTNALQVKAGDSISCSAGTITLTDAVNIAGQASSSDTYVVVAQ